MNEHGLQIKTPNGQITEKWTKNDNVWAEICRRARADGAQLKFWSVNLNHWSQVWA